MVPVTDRHTVINGDRPDNSAFRWRMRLYLGTRSERTSGKRGYNFPYFLQRVKECGVGGLGILT